MPDFAQQFELLNTVDQQQDVVLASLDELNARIEQALRDASQGLAAIHATTVNQPTSGSPVVQECVGGQDHSFAHKPRRIAA